MLGQVWQKARAVGPSCLFWPITIFIGGFFLFPTSKSHNNFYYLLVLFPFIFLVRNSDIRQLYESRIFRLTVVLTLYLAISGLWSDNFSWSKWLDESKGVVYVLSFIAIIALVLNVENQRRTFVAFIVVAGCIGSLWAMIEAVEFIWRYRDRPWISGFRMSLEGPTDMPVSSATILGVVTILAYFLLYRSSKRLSSRRVWLVSSALLAVSMVLTISRAPVMAMVLCVSFGVFQYRDRRLGVVILSGVAVCISLYVGVGIDFGSLIERGMSYRPAVWDQTMLRVAEKPWFGSGSLVSEEMALDAALVGRKRDMLIEHPHSPYLATLLYGGAVGTGLFAWLLWVGLREAWRQRDRDNGAWLLVFVFALLCMVTDGNRLIGSPHAIWFYFWLPIGVLVSWEIEAARKRKI